MQQEQTQIDVTAPIRIEGASNAETVFQWLLTNRYLWMVTEEHCDPLEAIVGTARLIRLAALLRRWKAELAEPADHPATVVPDEATRQRAYRRLERFLEMYINLDESFSSSPSSAAGGKRQASA